MKYTQPSGAKLAGVFLTTVAVVSIAGACQPTTPSSTETQTSTVTQPQATQPQATQPQATQSAANRLPPAPEGQVAVLVDDLEDNNRFNQFGGTWFTYDDRNQGGDSKVVPEGYSAFKARQCGPDGSSKCAHITGTVTTTFPDGFLGMGTDLKNPNKPVDIRQYDGIEFWARGDGKPYRMKFRATATSDYDDYGYNFEPGDQWQHYTIDFSQLKQEGWGQQANLDRALSGVISVTWQTVGQPHATIDLAVDNIRFLKSQ